MSLNRKLVEKAAAIAAVYHYQQQSPMIPISLFFFTTWVKSSARNRLIFPESLLSMDVECRKARVISLVFSYISIKKYYIVILTRNIFFSLDLLMKKATNKLFSSLVQVCLEC